MITRPPNSRTSGFTLFELVLAMALLTMLVGMVFGTARTSLALGNTIVATQNEEMLHQAFFELLHQRLSSLPGNTRLNLEVQDSGSHYLSDLTLQNVPLSFTWGGQARIAKAVQLSTVKRRSGYIDIVLKYYENEILDDSKSSIGGVLSEKPFAEIVLLEDIRYFEWRVLDGSSMEWQYDWDLQGRLPIQMELTLAIGAKGEEIRQVFWVPKKVNPEVRARQMGNPGNAPGNDAPKSELPGPGGRPGGGQDRQGGNGGNGRGPSVIKIQ
jgi:hypothetical protein